MYAPYNAERTQISSLITELTSQLSMSTPTYLLNILLVLSVSISKDFSCIISDSLLEGLPHEVYTSCNPCEINLSEYSTWKENIIWDYLIKKIDKQA